MKIRRVGVVPITNVPDVADAKIEMMEHEGPGRVLVHVRPLGIGDFKLVDLDGIEGIDRITPPFFFDRHRVLHFFGRLGQRNVQDGPFDEVIADDVAREQVPPLHAKVPSGKMCDRRVGVRGLIHRGVENLEGKIRI